MKMCDVHWERLKEAVKAKGMWHLVPQSGEEATRMLKAQLSGGATSKTYDPLMSCHNMIASNAVNSGGLHLLTGDLCPLCELDKNSEAMGETSDDWIEKSTQGALDYCRYNKLVAGVQ